jgi:hypothetical protein
LCHEIKRDQRQGQACTHAVARTGTMQACRTLTKGQSRCRIGGSMLARVTLTLLQCAAGRLSAKQLRLWRIGALHACRYALSLWLLARCLAFCCAITQPSVLISPAQERRMSGAKYARGLCRLPRTQPVAPASALFAAVLSCPHVRSMQLRRHPMWLLWARPLLVGHVSLGCDATGVGDWGPPA